MPPVEAPHRMTIPSENPIKSPPKMLDNIRSSVIVESEGIFWKNPSAIG